MAHYNQYTKREKELAKHFGVHLKRDTQYTFETKPKKKEKPEKRKYVRTKPYVRPSNKINAKKGKSGFLVVPGSFRQRVFRILENYDMTTKELFEFFHANKKQKNMISKYHHDFKKKQVNHSRPRLTSEQIQYLQDKEEFKNIEQVLNVYKDHDS